MTRKSMLTTAWGALIVAFTLVHFVHLQADFPNYSRWMDWAKYTDEGWYANAAIQHFVRGSWYVPGDFNIGPAVPVWPLLVWMLFHFTGVSLVAVRALAVTLFCVNVALSYCLVRRTEKTWVAMLCATMMVSSSFLFCLSRLAIVEPLLICLMLMSLMLASFARPRNLVAPIVLGVLFFLMILTKTTAMFLLPAILFSLWHPLRKNLRAFAQACFAMAIVAGMLWSVYFFFIVHPKYVEDYSYFFHINVYQKPHELMGWLRVLYQAAFDVSWVGGSLVLLFLLLVGSTLLLARDIWRKPLFGSALLAVATYVLFITYIDNMQPRYYVVIAFFLFIAVSMGISAILQANKLAGVVAIAICVYSIGRSSWETGGFVLYPEYTFVNAARNMASYMDKHPNGNRLVVSVSGSSLTLITGVPSLCDDFGTMDLSEKMALYKPGWYAAWNDLDPGTVQDIHEHYALDEVASFPAFDDDDRDKLNLYKLVPFPTTGPIPADISIPGTQQ